MKIQCVTSIKIKCWSWWNCWAEVKSACHYYYWLKFGGRFLFVSSFLFWKLYVPCKLQHVSPRDMSTPESLGWSYRSSRWLFGVGNMWGKFIVLHYVQWKFWKSVQIAIMQKDFFPEFSTSFCSQRIMQNEVFAVHLNFSFYIWTCGCFISIFTNAATRFVRLTPTFFTNCLWRQHFFHSYSLGFALHTLTPFFVKSHPCKTWNCSSQIRKYTFARIALLSLPSLLMTTIHWQMGKSLTTWFVLSLFLFQYFLMSWLMWISLSIWCYVRMWHSEKSLDVVIYNTPWFRTGTLHASSSNRWL